MKTVSRFISGIIHPLLIPLYMVFLMINFGPLDYFPISYKWLLMAITFSDIALLPAIGMLLLKKYGVISDLDVNDRTQRKYPFLIVMAGYFLAIFMFYRLGLFYWIIRIFIGCLFSIIIAFGITKYWKISAHSLSSGCAISGVFVFCKTIGSCPIYFLVTLIILAGLQLSSRIFLKAHTVSQTLSGFALGVVCVSSAFYLL